MEVGRLTLKFKGKLENDLEVNHEVSHLTCKAQVFASIIGKLHFYTSSH